MKKKSSRKSQIVVEELLSGLSQAGEVSLLPEVTEELEVIIRKERQAEKIVVTSCVLLSPLQQENLKKELREMINIDLPIVNRIDRNLIGGFTVQVGDWFLDASLTSQIDNLKKALI